MHWAVAQQITLLSRKDCGSSASTVMVKACHLIVQLFTEDVSDLKGLIIYYMLNQVLLLIIFPNKYFTF